MAQLVSKFFTATVATTALLATVQLSTATPASAADCGGSRVYSTDGHIRKWTMTWTNCAGQSSRKKIDIAYGSDLGCQTIPAGSWRDWTYAVSGVNPAHPRGFKNC